MKTSDPFAPRVLEIPVADDAVVMIREPGQPDRELRPGQKVRLGEPAPRFYGRDRYAGRPR